MLKQTLTRLRGKREGDFQGSKIGIFRSFYSSQGEILVHQLILCGNFTLFLATFVRILKNVLCSKSFFNCFFFFAEATQCSPLFCPYSCSTASMKVSLQFFQNHSEITLSSKLSLNSLQNRYKMFPFP